MDNIIEGALFENKYIIRSKNLSKKNSSYIFKVNNTSLNREEVIRIDHNNKEALYLEYNILSQFQNNKGFPQLFDSRFEKSPPYFTEESYFSDLNSLIKQYHTFDLSTTVSIFLQVISKLEILHSKQIIHGNVSPSHIGVSKHKPKVHLIGYNCSVDLKVKQNRNENKLRSELSCSFASTTTHNGITTFKGDLESLGYLIIYLFTGKLPWKGMFPKKTFSKWQKVFIIKRSKSPKELCQNCPKVFETYFSYVKALNNDQTADYSYLKNLIIDIVRINSINKFVWNSALRKRSKKKTTVKEKILRRKTDNPAQNIEKLNSKIMSRVNASKTLIASSNMSENPSSDVYVDTLEDICVPQFKNKNEILELSNKFQDEFKEKNEYCIVF